VIAVIVIGAFYGLVFLLLAVAICRVGRTPRHSDAQPAARDHDLCELLWAMPAYGDTADLDLDTDRLWAAIRDEQQKGDQA
jgi:hypothetical protein